MILYLQKDYDGTMSLAAKNTYKSDMNNADYVLVMGGINKNMTFKELNQLVIEKFGCRKLVIQF